MTKSDPDQFPSKRRPKMEAAVASLRKLIEDHPFGERLPSDRAMATKLGISNITVSTAMQELERMGLILRKSRSGSYRVNPRDSQHVAIYCEMDVFHPDSSRFFGKLIQHLRIILARRGIRSMPYVGLTPPSEVTSACTAPALLEDLAAGRICGMITTGVQGFDIRKAMDLGDLPIIGTQQKFHVSANSPRDLWLDGAVKMLFARGRRRIGLLLWDRAVATSGGSNQWAQAFKKSMAGCGLEVRPEWICAEMHPSLKGAGWEEIREIWTAHPELKPDGLIIADDMLFRDAMIAFDELGIRPGDNVDIVAHATSGLGFPDRWPMILVITDAEKIASSLVDLLEEWMENGKPEHPRHICVEPEWRIISHEIELKSGPESVVIR